MASLNFLFCSMHWMLLGRVFRRREERQKKRLELRHGRKEQFPVGLETAFVTSSPTSTRQTEKDSQQGGVEEPANRNAYSSLLCFVYFARFRCKRLLQSQWNNSSPIVDLSSWPISRLACAHPFFSRLERSAVLSADLPSSTLSKIWRASDQLNLAQADIFSAF